MARTKIPLLILQDTGAFAANAKVQIANRATGTETVVYASEGGGTVLPQPLVCDSRGRCPGWVDRGAYTAVVSGTGVTAYSESFDSAPASAGSVDSDWIADAAIGTTKVSPQAITSDRLAPAVDPLGSIRLWWRPSDTVPVPVGYAVADGSTLVAGQHDFPVAGSVILPDLRNATLVGADEAKAWGTPTGAPGTAARDVSKAPGIGGTGGSNGTRDMAHTHVVPPHSHAATVSTAPAHTHTDNFAVQLNNIGQPEAWNLPISDTSWNGQAIQVGGASPPGGLIWEYNFAHTGSVTSDDANVTYASGVHAHALSGGVLAGGAHSHTVTVGSGTDPAKTALSTSGSGTLPRLDPSPFHVGVLMLIKVRNG